MCVWRVAARANGDSGIEIIKKHFCCFFFFFFFFLFFISLFFFSQVPFFPFRAAERTHFLMQKKKHVKFAGEKRGAVALFHVSDLCIVAVNSRRGRAASCPTHTATSHQHHPTPPPSPPPLFFSHAAPLSPCQRATSFQKSSHYMLTDHELPRTPCHLSRTGAIVGN